MKGMQLIEFEAKAASNVDIGEGTSIQLTRLAHAKRWPSTLQATLSTTTEVLA